MDLAFSFDFVGFDIIQCMKEYEGILDTKIDLSKSARKSKYKRINKYFRNRKHKTNCMRDTVLIDDTYCDDNNYFNHIKKSENGIYYAQRFYLSGCRKICKKQTNKKTRNSFVGDYGNYRKLFDYQNVLY